MNFDCLCHDPGNQTGSGSVRVAKFRGRETEEVKQVKKVKEVKEGRRGGGPVRVSGYCGATEEI